MAIWVSFKKVKNFPAVIDKYARAGHGQGQGATGTNSKKGFWYAVKAAVVAGSSWVRSPPVLGKMVDFQDAQIDVTAIPLVPALMKNGKRSTLVVGGPG
jgi:hypothetical protein